MKNEKLTYKVSFDTFRKKLADYVPKDFKNGRHVVSLIEDLEDPIPEFVRENKQKIKRGSTVSATTTDDSEEDVERKEEILDPNDEVDKMLLQTKLKAVEQQNELVNNINKIYVIVWG